MILLTPYTTVLRVNEADGTIIHTPLVPVPEGSVDLSLDVTAAPAGPVPLPNLPGTTLTPGGQKPLMRLTRGAENLYVHPTSQTAVMRNQQEAPFAFLLVTEKSLATLRYLLAHQWVIDEMVPREITFVPRDGLQLEAGDFVIDIARHMPVTLPQEDRFARLPERLLLADGSTTLTIRCVGESRDEILIQPAATYWAPQPAETAAAFHACTNRTLPLPGDEELLTLPLTVCDADRAWLHKIPKTVFEQPVGRHRFTPSVVRQRDKFVMLSRFVEGVMFDEHGGVGELGYLENIGSGGDRHLTVPPGIRREGKRIFADRNLLARMPVRDGPHVIFYGSTLTNYTHWLIDSMLPLFIMRPHLPANATLLLPGTLRGFRDNPTKICDHYDILNLCGFGDMRRAEVGAPFCRVEEAFWLEQGAIHTMPAAFIRGFRAHLAALRPAPARADLRLYIARRGTRRVTNQAELEGFLAARRFRTYYLEDLSAAAQMDLFAQAEFVVSPHGAELGNLLFCRDGTKVLELAPNDEFRHYFSFMCNKLGLAHGILPCPTHDGSFFGDMSVDMQKFAALFRMLKARL